MLDIVCFKWKPAPGYRSKFGPETVNILSRMVARNYGEHRFSCITDDPSGIDKHIRVIPLWSEFANVPSPHGVRNPSCYRRLKLFSPEAANIVGNRFAVMDLDTVILGDIRPILDRPEEFIMWREIDPRSYYNGSLWMMTAGARRQVYDKFNPATSPQEAKKAGRFGSDQGWISHILGRGEATWKDSDGIYSFRLREHLDDGRKPLPSNARMVMFHGGTDPDSPRAQRIPWIRKHYR